MKLTRSFIYACNGIKTCFVSERNFRVHVVAAFIVLACSVVLQISTAEWMAVIFCIGFVITMEMLNTAIEKLCDVDHPEMHPGIKMIKDISAGAVLIAALVSTITGLVIFLPRIMNYLN